MKCPYTAANMVTSCFYTMRPIGRIKHNIMFKIVSQVAVQFASLRLHPIFLTIWLPAHLSFVTHFKYLGHIIENTLHDDSDINPELRCLFTRTNVLIRCFWRCSVDVKL